jgi:threonine aldolase
MIERLADDHANARRLAQGLANIEGIKVDPDSIQTNIVIFEIEPSVGTAPEVLQALAEAGVKVTPSRAQTLRMVTHRQVDSADVEEALARVSEVVGTLRGQTKV